MHAIHDNGVLISLGTVLADPLPFGLAAVPLSGVDAAGLVDGSRVWDPSTRTVVPTPGWVDPAIAEGNRTTLEGQAAAALTTNTTYLAIPTPTATQVRVQSQALTRQMNGAIRLLLGRLESTNGA